MRSLRCSFLALPLCAAALLMLPGSAATAVASTRGEELVAGYRPGAVVPGELLVRFGSGTDSRRINSILADRDASSLRRLPLLPRLHLVHLGETGGESRVAARLEDLPEVIAASPNRYLDRQLTPADPRLGEQWALHNAGQPVVGFRGVADADIDAPEGWDLFPAPPGTEIPVAVVDTGISQTHPDLAGMHWANPGEVPGNGLDDDLNGFTDDVHGWDFVQSDPNPDDSPDDPDQGHGTFIGGIIAARGSNGIGIAGLGFNPSWNIRLMALRALTLDQEIAAFAYAGMNGARIVNYSAGGPFPDLLEEAAIEANPNVLYAVAAGNSAKNVDTEGGYPCGYDSPNLLCVAATGQSDRLTGFSNFGPFSVELAAPGDRILSTVPAGAKTTDLADGFEALPLGGRWFRGRRRGKRWGSSGGFPPGLSVADSPRGRYRNRSNTWIRSRSIDLSQRRGCQLSWAMLLRTERRHDRLIVEASRNLRRWRKLASFSGRRGGHPIERLPRRFHGDSSVWIRFRMRTDRDLRRDGAYVDSVVLACVASAHSWSFARGTSFSAPHVAGVAALVWAANPGLSRAQVQTAALDVDPKPFLAGRVTTGGRLNALRAMAPPFP